MKFSNQYEEMRVRGADLAKPWGVAHYPGTDYSVQVPEYGDHVLSRPTGAYVTPVGDSAAASELFGTLFAGAVVVGVLWWALRR